MAAASAARKALILAVSILALVGRVLSQAPCSDGFSVSLNPTIDGDSAVFEEAVDFYEELGYPYDDILEWFGDRECVPCAPGTFAAGGTTRACTPCPVASIAPDAQASECEPCPPRRNDKRCRSDVLLRNHLRCWAVRGQKPTVWRPPMLSLRTLDLPA